MVALQEDSQTASTFPLFTTAGGPPSSDTAIGISASAEQSEHILRSGSPHIGVYLRDARVDVPLDFHRNYSSISCEAFSTELRCSISDTVHAVSSENDTQIARKKTKEKENNSQSFGIIRGRARLGDSFFFFERG